MKKNHCTIIRAALIAAFLLAVSNVALALSPGGMAPPLSEKQWLFNGPFAVPQPVKDGKDADAPAAPPPQGFYLLGFWAADSVICANFAPALSLLQERFRSRGLKCAVLFKEGEPAVKQLLSSCEDINFAVGLDNGGKTFTAYLEPGVVLPVFFVLGPDGKVLWRGSALDIEAVTAKICEGSFEFKKEEKLSSMRKEMQSAMQAGVMENVLKLANRMLEVDPNDDFAVRGALFVFDQRGRTQEALAFVESAIMKAPARPQLHMAKLSLLARAGRPSADFQAALNAARQALAENPEGLCAIALASLDTLPFAAVPPALPLEMAESALKKLPETAPVPLRAVCLETLARANHMAGRGKDALQRQTEACALLKGSPAEAAAEARRSWYEEVLKLSNPSKD